MIAALKQYGTNYARRTVRRQLINYAIGGALVITGGAYYLVTGKPYPGAESSEPEPAPVVHHPLPRSRAKLAARRSGDAAAGDVSAGAPITAQGIDINAPKRAAQKAVDATNARSPRRRDRASRAARRRRAGLRSGQRPSERAAGAAGVAPSAAPTAISRHSVTREVYGYTGAGRAIRSSR